MITLNQTQPDAVASDDTVHDLIIIGSGPAGYTAAIYAGRAQLDVLVIEGTLSGGALMNTTEVENFPGFPDGIMGPELMNNFRSQAEKFGATLITDDVVTVDLNGDIKSVTDSSGVSYRSRAVIVATGSSYRHLNIPGEEEFSGRGVSWCATCDGFFYRDKVVAVVGGGDAAVEEANFLTRFASKVYLIHRRNELRASKIMADRALANEKIEMVWDSVVTEARGDSKLTEIVVQNVRDESTTTLAVDGLFEAIGNVPNSQLFAGVLDCDPQGYVLVEQPTTLTNVAGVFACGDLVDSHYQQAITAAASGCRAALDAESYLAGLN